MNLSNHQRQRFDRLLEQVLDDLPPDLAGLFDEIPLVVEDRPSPGVMRELGIRHADELCGLHTGIPLTQRSVEHSGALPTVVTIYRLGILAWADQTDSADRDSALREQIRITVLHELGHHFGLDEDDLRNLGYH